MARIMPERDRLGGGNHLEQVTDRRHGVVSNLERHVLLPAAQPQVAMVEQERRPAADRIDLHRRLERRKRRIGPTPAKLGGGRCQRANASAQTTL